MDEHSEMYLGLVGASRVHAAHFESQVRSDVGRLFLGPTLLLALAETRWRSLVWCSPPLFAFCQEPAPLTEVIRSHRIVMDCISSFAIQFIFGRGVNVW